MWSSMRKITGFEKKNNTCTPTVDNVRDYVNDLNTFYCRFDSHDFSTERNSVRDTLLSSDNHVSSVLEFDELCVSKALSSVNPNKGPGPDCVTPKVLKYCAEQLSFIFTHIFNMSIRTSCVPQSWKMSCIIPVPKKPVCNVMNDFRPVAMTSSVMKVFERLLLSVLQNKLTEFIDPLQFAYRKNRSVEDAILFVLNSVYEHLEIPGSYVRMMFFDFSSAFNTIQPHLMANKLLNMNVDQNTILWILDYLTNRPQFVKLSNHMSSIMTTNTGAPQGTVLSPFLFSVYTSDCVINAPSCPLVRYADDTSLSGLISNNDESSYRSAITSFVNWCDQNYLLLNVSKTKEMVVDFRKGNKTEHQPVFIKGGTVEIVPEYKYLGVVFDENLSWSENTTNFIKKSHTRIFGGVRHFGEKYFSAHTFQDFSTSKFSNLLQMY